MIISSHIHSSWKNWSKELSNPYNSTDWISQKFIFNVNVVSKRQFSIDVHTLRKHWLKNIFCAKSRYKFHQNLSNEHYSTIIEVIYSSQKLSYRFLFDNGKKCVLNHLVLYFWIVSWPLYYLKMFNCISMSLCIYIYMCAQIQYCLIVERWGRFPRFKWMIEYFLR